MSWDSYRDTLTGSGAVARAAVCGLEDGGIWSQSADFNLNPAEIKAISGAFKDAGSIRANGINLGGIKYFCLQADTDQIQGKKGSTGVSIAKSTRCIIIGTYNDTQQPGNCRKQVEAVRDYLQTNGY